MAAFTPAFFERVRGFGLETERPVFIVGLPRSGTTLTEQILAAHSQVFGAGELHLAREDFQALGTQPTEESIFAALSGLQGDAVRRLAQRHLDQLADLEPHGRAHRGQDAGQLSVSRPAGGAVSQGEVHPLPPRSARRGRVLLDDSLSPPPLGQRSRAHRRPFPGISTADGALAERCCPSRCWKSTTRRRWPTCRAWPGDWWSGADWTGNRHAWLSTKASGRCAPPASFRCASPSTRDRWRAGGNYERDLGPLFAALKPLLEKDS